jgi:proteasome assembly chaperone (PAC2) family protein
MATTDHVMWHSKPALRRPVVVAAFQGWNDAADGASTAVRTLVEAWKAQPLADIDPEDFTDFATIRPSVRLRNTNRRDIVWPKVSMWHASTPGSDVILLLGPEPSLRWRLFTEQVLAVAEEYDSSMVITLGALVADVAHSRATRVMGTSSDDTMIERFDLQRPQYEGPTGIIGVLNDAFVQSSIPSVSLWATVPAYAAQIPSPKAANALIQRTGELIGTPPPLGALHNDVVEYDEQIQEMVDSDEDLAEYVRRLEELGEDAAMSQNQLEFQFDDDDDDTGSSLVDEVEQFLRDQDSN